MFASESNTKLHGIIETHCPERLYVDAADSSKFAKKIDLDLYVAGPPCQRYSGITKKTSQHCGISTCIKTILFHRPTHFILENVRQAKSTLMRHSEMLARNKYKCLCITISPTMIGFPQERHRTYLIGTLEKVPTVSLVKHTRHLWDMIDQKSETQEIKNTFVRKYKSAYPGHILNAGNMGWHLRNNSPVLSNSRASKTTCPCLHSCYWKHFYIVDQNRYLNHSEALRLQGFRSSVDFSGMTKADIGRAVGNSMCVPVIMTLVRALLS